MFNADFGKRIVGILDSINELRMDVNNRVVKGIKINNIALITDDISVTSDMIPFELDGVVYNQTVTERLMSFANPFNIRGNVNTLDQLPQSGNLPNDAWVVLRDADNDNGQWLHLWTDRETQGVFKWEAVTPFGVDLTNFYTKDETWSSAEIIADQLRQDNAVRAYITENSIILLNAAHVAAAAQITANNNAINNAIAEAQRIARAHTDAQAQAIRNSFVPITRTINRRPLNANVELASIDIFHRGESLYRILMGLQTVTRIMGSVQTADDLPTPTNNGDSWIVREGEGGAPDFWMALNGEWIRLSSFEANLDNYYTIPEIDALLNNKQSLIQAMIDDLRASLSAEIVSMGHNAVQTANNYTDAVIQPLKGIVDGKVDQSFPVPLVTGATVNPNSGTSEFLSLARVFLNGSAAPALNALLEAVSPDRPGLMTPALLRELINVREWMESFTGGGLFIGAFPTRAALNSAPIQTTWNNNDWATVLEDETRLDGFGNPQLTKYVFDTMRGWVFSNVQGGAMPGTGSNTRSGLVRGFATGAGNVSLDSDGRPSVLGWDALINRLLNSEAEIGLNSQGMPINPATGLRFRVNQLDANKADRVPQTARNSLVSVNVNSQGVVTGGDTVLPSSAILGFNAIVDSRVDARIAAVVPNLITQANTGNGQINVNIRNQIASLKDELLRIIRGSSPPVNISLGTLPHSQTVINLQSHMAGRNHATFRGQWNRGLNAVIVIDIPQGCRGQFVRRYTNDRFWMNFLNSGRTDIGRITSPSDTVYFWITIDRNL